jgi:hypothetical protein
MRSPLAFPKSFRCRTRVYYGIQQTLYESASQKLPEPARAASRAGEAVNVPGDHNASADPAMR